MEPTAPKERIHLLDVLRGCAGFGMFTVNMTAHLPWGWEFREQPLDGPDGTVMILIDLLTNGRFFTIFSFLFGIGFFLQLERARSRGVPFLATYLRRLVALFLIAAVTIVANVDAGILISYAFFGLALPFFDKRSERFLLAAIVVCVTLQIVLSHLDTVSNLFTPTQSEQIELVDGQSDLDAPANDRERVYREGSFLEIAKYRASRLVKHLFSWDYLATSDPILLALMLLGCYVCRRGALQHSEARMRMARATLPWLLTIGVAGTVTYVWLRHFVDGDSDLLTLIRDLALWPVGAPFLGLGYVAILTLVIEKEAWQRVMLPFAHVGRMALTNYLFHGLVIAAFTYQWGLGLYGKMGPFWGLMAVFAVFPLMAIASSWWIGRFRFGPVEWLWRTLTYGQIQPLRRTPRPHA